LHGGCLSAPVRTSNGADALRLPAAWPAALRALNGRPISATSFARNRLVLATEDFEGEIEVENRAPGVVDICIPAPRSDRRRMGAVARRCQGSCGLCGSASMTVTFAGLPAGLCTWRLWVTTRICPTFLPQSQKDLLPCWATGLILPT
jgi:hypothetical protein